MNGGYTPVYGPKTDSAPISLDSDKESEKRVYVLPE